MQPEVESFFIFRKRFRYSFTVWLGSAESFSVDADLDIKITTLLTINTTSSSPELLWL
jgi:hypothetical protein